MPRFEGNELLALIERLRGSFYHRGDQGIVIDGNLIFSGLARRIKGAFGNATRSNRPTFQADTAASTNLQLIPGVGGTGSFFAASVGTDASNSQGFFCGLSSASAYVGALNIVGDANSGASLPLTFQTSGAVRANFSPSGGMRLTSTLGGYPTVVSDAVGNMQLDGSLGFTNTAPRIVGNADHATIANRLHFIPSVANARGYVGFLPNGTGDQSAVRVHGSSDPDNSGWIQMIASRLTSQNIIASDKTGTGTQYPLVFTIGGATAFHVSTNRALWIGRTTASVLTDAVGMVEVEGSVSVKTSVVHIATAAPGSPLAGEVWQDSTQKALSTREAGVTQNLVGTIFTATADKNINTTAAETTLFGTGVGTLTLPANFWAIGKTVRVTMRGYWSQTNLSPTRTLKVKLGAVAVCSTALVVNASTVTDKGWSVDVLVTCRTLGVTGTVMGQGIANLEGNAAPYGTATTATATVDTTASQVLDVTWTFGTSSASNKVVVTNATVEVLN